MLHYILTLHLLYHLLAYFRSTVLIYPPEIQASHPEFQRILTCIDFTKYQNDFGCFDTALMSPLKNRIDQIRKRFFFGQTLSKLADPLLEMQPHSC